jgi:hypothetical protein
VHRQEQHDRVPAPHLEARQVADVPDVQVREPRERARVFDDRDRLTAVADMPVAAERVDRRLKELDLIRSTALVA